MTNLTEFFFDDESTIYRERKAQPYKEFAITDIIHGSERLAAAIVTCKRSNQAFKRYSLHPKFLRVDNILHSSCHVAWWDFQSSPKTLTSACFLLQVCPGTLLCLVQVCLENLTSGCCFPPGCPRILT